MKSASDNPSAPRNGDSSAPRSGEPRSAARQTAPAPGASDNSAHACDACGSSRIAGPAAAAPAVAPRSWLGSPFDEFDPRHLNYFWTAWPEYLAKRAMHPREFIRFSDLEKLPKVAQALFKNYENKILSSLVKQLRQVAPKDRGALAPCGGCESTTPTPAGRPRLTTAFDSKNIDHYKAFEKAIEVVNDITPGNQGGRILHFLRPLYSPHRYHEVLQKADYLIASHQNNILRARFQYTLEMRRAADDAGGAFGSEDSRARATTLVLSSSPVVRSSALLSVEEADDIAGLFSAESGTARAVSMRTVGPAMLADVAGPSAAAAIPENKKKSKRNKKKRAATANPETSGIPQTAADKEKNASASPTAVDVTAADEEEASASQATVDVAATETGPSGVAAAKKKKKRSRGKKKGPTSTAVPEAGSAPASPGLLAADTRATADKSKVPVSSRDSDEDDAVSNDGTLKADKGKTVDHSTGPDSALLTPSSGPPGDICLTGRPKVRVRVYGKIRYPRPTPGSEASPEADPEAGPEPRPIGNKYQLPTSPVATDVAMKSILPVDLPIPPQPRIWDVFQFVLDSGDNTDSGTTTEPNTEPVEGARRATESEERARRATESDECARRATESDECARRATESDVSARRATESEERARLATESGERACLATESEERARLATESEERARRATESEERARLAAESEERARRAMRAARDARVNYLDYDNDWGRSYTTTGNNLDNEERMRRTLRTVRASRFNRTHAASAGRANRPSFGMGPLYPRRLSCAAAIDNVPYEERLTLNAGHTPFRGNPPVSPLTSIVPGPGDNRCAGHRHGMGMTPLRPIESPVGDEGDVPRIDPLGFHNTFNNVNMNTRRPLLRQLNETLERILRNEDVPAVLRGPSPQHEPAPQAEPTPDAGHEIDVEDSGDATNDQGPQDDHDQ